MTRCCIFRTAIAFCVSLFFVTPYFVSPCFAAVAQAQELSVLFLGDQGPHQPRQRFVLLEPALSARGIKLTYTENLADLNADTLSQYDALLLYANIDKIDAPQEKALLNYVAGGGGFVPIHCATYCFRNSDEIVKLMGAQFQRHGTGVFRTEIANANHPIMNGFGGFESWDETYVHHLHNEKDRTVLAYRVDEQGKEPWTWVRTQGTGRVFYTAWGHDYRTWRNPGFHNLVERGIRWAAGSDPAEVPEFLSDRPFPIPKITPKRTDVKPFEYVDVGNKIPNYTPGKTWGALGQAISKMQKPLPADQSLKHFVVPEGFRVELFASEPLIGGKPICMNWDERGRLWIAETYDYPNELQPDGKGRDRIRILEDTDGDGRADKTTVFAEGLSIPTSLTFSRGGVIVQDGNQTRYFKDTNGDDVSDESSVLFDGWGIGDTHGGVSNFQYGLDNWIWGMQGYNNSQPTSAEHDGQRFRQGFFRFRGNASEVEFLRSTNNNTWGLGFSEEGIVFGSTANGCPSVYMPIPNRYYERVRGWAPSLVLGNIADSYKFEPITENVRQVDWHGGYTAGAGHALYTARTYPQQYWNRTAFVNGPTGHLVGTFVLQSEGSDFKSTSPFNLIASDDQWTAPIMSEVGPDGNVWVIDWYNYIVQHNPTPQGFETGKGNAYKTDLRDKKYGRVYRVVYGDKAAPPMTLAGATSDKLVQTLKHPNMLWRKHAQRLLVERGLVDVVPRLTQLVADNSTDEIGLNVGAIHALWTLHGLGQLDGSNSQVTKLAIDALNDHQSAGVRRNAVQVLPNSKQSTEAILNAGALSDPDAQVRLMALLALSDLPAHPNVGPTLVKLLDRELRYGDRWISDAAVSAAANNDVFFLKALSQSGPSPNPKLVELVKIVAEHYARGGPIKSLPEVIAATANAQPVLTDAMISGLANGWPADKSPNLDPGLEENLQIIVDRLEPANRGSFVKLARGWGSKRFEDYARRVSTELLARVDDDSLAAKDRIAAAQELVMFRSKDGAVVSDLLDLITPQLEPELADGIVNALRASESAQVGKLVAKQFRRMTPQTRASAIVLLLGRTESTQSLLDMLDSGKVLLSELALEQQQFLTSNPDQAVRQRALELFERGGALPDADRQKVLKEMLVVTKQKGDPAAGKLIFKKQCANCHQFNGEGVKIGPDLTGMSVHPKAELLTHIIDPSRDVEGNYRRYMVSTVDGIVINGLLASESKMAIELYDAEGKKQVILREDIDDLTGSTKSIMPEGFEKQIPKPDMANLLEYLTQRGQYAPVTLRKVATISSATGMFFAKENDVERLIFKDWSPKTFQGIPFHLTDPEQGKVANAILLFGPLGNLSRKMPKSVQLPCNASAKAIHMLGGVSGWGHPYSTDKTVSMIVRLKYADGTTEDHKLRNGVHFADYIRRVDVPESTFAFAVRGQQLRYLAVRPKRADMIEMIEFIKGPDQTAPVVMAVTIEQAVSPH